MKPLESSDATNSGLESMLWKNHQALARARLELERLEAHLLLHGSTPPDFGPLVESLESGQGQT